MIRVKVDDRVMCITKYVVACCSIYSGHRDHSHEQQWTREEQEKEKTNMETKAVNIAYESVQSPRLAPSADGLCTYLLRGKTKRGGGVVGESTIVFTL